MPPQPPGNVCVLSRDALGELHTAPETYSSREIFYWPEWFDLLARTALDPEDLVDVYCVGPSDGFQLCLPIVRPGAPTRPRRLKGLANYYSSLFGPIVFGADLPASAIEEVACAIADARPRFDVLDFRPLDTTNPFHDGMMSALRKRGYWVDSYFCFGNWYLDVPGSFSDYLATRSSQLRNTVNRAERKLERNATYELTICQEDGPTLGLAIAAFESVYSRSWKQPEPHPQFIPELCKLAAGKRWLRLGVVNLDGEPVAAQIWLVNQRKASIFKLAYDQRHAKTSVGSVLTSALMKHVIEKDGVTEVDYLTGDDSYKKDWMSGRRERVGVVAFSTRSPLGIVEATKHFGGKRAKPILRRWRREQ